MYIIYRPAINPVLYISIHIDTLCRIGHFKEYIAATVLGKGKSSQPSRVYIMIWWVVVCIVSVVLCFMQLTFTLSQ